MAYREDHEAALQRAAALERQLAEAEARTDDQDRELERVRGQLARARAELAAVEARKPSSSPSRRPGNPNTGPRAGRVADGSCELPWNRTFGWGIVIAGIALGVAIAFNVSDPGDPTDWEAPWWLGPIVASPIVLFGLAFTVNRSRWRIDGEQLVATSWPVPIPRRRQLALARIASIEVRRAADSKRDDLVAVLASPEETVALFKGLRSEGQGQSAAGMLNSDLLAARRRASQ